MDAVVGNYYTVGVRRFVMGGAVLTHDWVDDLRTAAGMSLVVVRLTLPIEEIERRLSTAGTAGRADDLEVARAWDAEGRGDGIGDLVIENDRAIDQIASDVLAFAGGDFLPARLSRWVVHASGTRAAISPHVAAHTSSWPATYPSIWSSSSSRYGRPITCGCIVSTNAPPYSR